MALSNIIAQLTSTLKRQKAAADAVAEYLTTIPSDDTIKLAELTQLHTARTALYQATEKELARVIAFDRLKADERNQKRAK